MAQRKHVLSNKTSAPQFVTFELSTRRYRISPGEELVFFYEDEFVNAAEPPLVLDFVEGKFGIEIVIWTNFGPEDGPFLANGQRASVDYYDE